MNEKTTKPEEQKETKYPRKLTTPFLEEKKKFLSNKIEQKEELKEFVLLLMKNNGHTDFIEGVQPGEFFLKSADGKQEKSILLTPNKLTTFTYNKQYWKGWVAHEDNMMPYPQDPLHNGEMYRKTTQKLAMNYKEANEAKALEAKRKNTIIIILVALGAVYVLFLLLKNAGVFGGEEAIATATKNATQLINQTLNSTGTRL